MTTKKNGVTSTSKKSVSKSVKGAASAAGVSSASVAAVTAAAVAGSASSSSRAKAINAGLVSAAAVPAGRASAVASAVMEQDTKVIDLRTKIASKWAAPRFEDSEEYTIMAAALAAVPADLRYSLILAGSVPVRDRRAVLPAQTAHA